MKYELNTYKNYDLGSLPKDSIKELEEYSYLCATEGSVLLENKNNVLPLQRGDKAVIIIGRTAGEISIAP